MGTLLSAFLASVAQVRDAWIWVAFLQASEWAEGSQLVDFIGSRVMILIWYRWSFTKFSEVFTPVWCNGFALNQSCWGVLFFSPSYRSFFNSVSTSRFTQGSFRVVVMCSCHWLSIFQCFPSVIQGISDGCASRKRRLLLKLVFTTMHASFLRLCEPRKSCFLRLQPVSHFSRYRWINCV